MSTELEVLPSLLPHKFRELKTLARRINDRQEEIDGLKNQLNDLANTLGRTLRLQGQDLKLAREEIKPGLWLDWLASHCPKTSARTASFAMNVASRQNAADFDQCDTWKECYQLARAEAPEVKPEPRPWPTAPSLRVLNMLEAWIDALGSAPLEKCSPAILERYREHLLPIVKVLWPE